MALSLDGTTGISATGNIWGNNIIVPGTLTVGTFSPGALSTAGNITGNYIFGNGSQLTGIDATSIQSGTSNVRVISSGGNVTTGIGGTADVVVVASTGQYITGISSTSGNVTGGNLITAGLISATGNVTGGNLITAGLISATGNVTGNYILGNGSQLTGIDATSIQNGTANVQTYANGNVTTSAAGTANVVVVTSTGTITTGSASATGTIVGGNLVTTGTVSATGNATAGNVFTSGLISATGNITGGNLQTGGAISATGAITGSTLTAGGFTLTGNSIVSTNSTITIDPNAAGGIDGAVIIAGNLSVQGNVTYIDSNVITTNEKSITLANNQSTGAALDGSGIDVGNANQYTWRFNNATTSWQSNIGITPTANTTLNLGGASNYWGNAFIVTASIAGNVTGGNLLTGGLISATGNVTGANLRTAGSLVTATISATGNVIIDGYLSSAGMTVFAPGLLVANGIRNGSANGVSNIGESATVFNTLFIKDVLATGLVSAVGNTTAGNILTAGIMSSTGNAIHGNILTGGLISATGNATAGNILTAGIMSSTGNAIHGNILTAGIMSSTGNAIHGNILTAGLISATGAITGAAITGTSLTVSTGNVTLGNIINANGNGVGNIGSSSLYFNTVFAKATSAQYADLAEKYVADAAYEPGTVLKFGGEQEVTMATEFDDTRVAGVVSTNPSYLMNATQSGMHVVDIALQGRVPCKVRGPVYKGDLMVSGGSGLACANNQARAGTILGKSLQDFTGEFGTIEIAIGRD